MLNASQKRIIIYYSIGAAFALLLFRTFSATAFSIYVDYFMIVAAGLVVMAMASRAAMKYHRDHGNLRQVVHNALVNTLILLAITLLAYLLYSPRIFSPVVGVINNLNRYISLENYFLLALYICLITILVALVNLLFKTYQRVVGDYSGSIRHVVQETLHTVFFIFAILFALSIAAYSEAFSPVTDFAGRVIYNTFFESEPSVVYTNPGTKSLGSFKTAVNETFKNITESVSGSQDKLVTDIIETKENLTEVIGGTSSELKEDIEKKLNLKGGTLKGDLTMGGTINAEDIVPNSNGTYSLGSNSKAWNLLYTEAIDYAGGTLSLENNRLINLGTPTGAQDAATKGYVDTQIAASPALFSQDGTVLSPTTSGDSLNMLNAVISNIGNAGTDFTASGGLNLAGVLTATSASTHTLGSVTIAGGAIAGTTDLAMSGILDLGTNTIADGELNGNWDFNSGDVSGVEDLTVTRNLFLPKTLRDTSDPVGVIYSDEDVFAHNAGSNTFLGLGAGHLLGMAGNFNTGVGEASLYNNFVGNNNTSIGYNAMLLNTNGDDNTALGYYALLRNDGDGNTASGSSSMYNNTTGNYNSASGYRSLYSNTTGAGNSTVGYKSLYSSTTGGSNSAVGRESLYSNTIGASNIAIGYRSLYSNISGSNNTAIGSQSGYSNSTGSSNIFLGYEAGYSETGSNKLYIDNSSTATPLIYGDFSANSLIFNGTANFKGAAGAVTLDIDSNETTAENNIFTVSSDVGGPDDLKFKVQADGDVYIDGANYTTGADYAEYFKSSDSDLAAGELVCINTANNNLIERCKRTKDTNAIGIVSSNPAFVGNNLPGAEANLGEKDKDYKLVGLIGQVETKVTNENGEIASGDSLTAATKPGYAMKADAGDTTVGVALESSDKETDTITVLISRKNKSVTVEQVEAETEKRIAAMDIEDQVNALIDNQLSSVETETGKLKADLATFADETAKLMAAIQAQIEDLRARTSEELSLAQIDLNKNDLDFLKLTLGVGRVKNPEDIDILGKLSAKEIVAENYTVKNTDEKAKTLGTATIAAGEIEVTIKTEAVGEDARIFVTPIINEPILWSISKKTKGESFTLKINEAVESDLKFDWWLVKEEKGE